MPTVLMLSWEYPPHLVGGLSRHVQALSREMVTQGHRVVVLTRSASDQPARTTEDGVEVVRVQPYFQEPQDFRLWVNHLNFALLEAGVEVLRSLDHPAILHAHDWLVAFAAKGLKHLFRMPLVATIHATEYGRHGGIHDSGQQYINDVEWWLTYEAWRVIVCSEAMRDEVRRLFGLTGDKVAVIPNGVDLGPAPTAKRVPMREAFVAPEERLIFHIGRLVPEKGAGVLLDAMPYLLRRHRCRLVIGGVGPYRDDLGRRAHELGVAPYVTFAGWLADDVARALYRYADVAVVPSTYEPFGIVALEAMAAGAPLVASDVGGLSEIVSHGVNGLKTLPGDPLSLARQIDRVLGDPVFAHRITAEGQRLVRERYAWSSVARATAELYQGVAEAWAETGWAANRASAAPPTRLAEAPGRYTM